MRIKPVDCNQPGCVKQFIEVPFQLYKGNPLWAPPLLVDARRELDHRRHPFYEHGEAAFFVAEEGGRLLGRIGVMDNHHYNRYAGADTAFWGYFEAVNDEAVSQELFAAAFAWARARGLKQMVGPKTLIGTDANGILVEGFEHPPALTVPYNHSYYNSLVSAAGFTKELDFLSGRLTKGQALPDRLYRIAQRAKDKGGFVVKEFSSKKEMQEWVPKVVQVYNEAFVGAPEFYPVTDAEAAVVAKTILSVAEPGLIKIIIKDDRPVGFLLAYRNINEGLRRSGGRLFPWGWFHLWQAWRRADMIDINGLGLLPEYQGVGANALLYTELEKSLNTVSWKCADVVLVAEDNFRSYSDMQTMGVQWYKRHRRYRRTL